MFRSFSVFPVGGARPLHTPVEGGGPPIAPPRESPFPPHGAPGKVPLRGGAFGGRCGGPSPQNGCGCLFIRVAGAKGPQPDTRIKKTQHTIYYIIKNNKKKQGAPPTRPYSTHNSRQRPARKRDGVVCGGRVRAPVVFCLVFYKGLGARGAPARRGKQCSRLRPRRHGPEGNRSDTAINSTQNKYTINHSINQVRADDCRWL